MSGVSTRVLCSGRWRMGKAFRWTGARPVFPGGGTWIGWSKAQRGLMAGPECRNETKAARGGDSGTRGQWAGLTNAHLAIMLFTRGVRARALPGSAGWWRAGRRWLIIPRASPGHRCGTDRPQELFTVHVRRGAPDVAGSRV